MPLQELAAEGIESQEEGPSDYVRKVQLELQRRLIEALWRYNEQAARATFWLIVLTAVLVVLTIVLVIVAVFD